MDFAERFPLHFAILVKNSDDLKHYLGKLPEDLLAKEKILEQHDTHGRSPLCLAVILQNIDCVKLLLDAGADASAISRDYWSVINEATCTGNRDLLGLCLKFRDYQQHKKLCRLAFEILEKLSRTIDFYVEMKWEFNSWSEKTFNELYSLASLWTQDLKNVKLLNQKSHPKYAIPPATSGSGRRKKKYLRPVPSDFSDDAFAAVPFVSKMCPSDVYKIYKRGRNLRFDTTLIGFENNQWKRGQQTFIFKASDDDANAAQFSIIDHDARTVFNEILKHDDENHSQHDLPEAQHDVLDDLLKSPVSTFYVDLENACFERKQEGLFGWFAEKVAEIDNYECKVYKTANVNAVTKTRLEHLDHRMRETYEQSKKSSFTSLDSWLYWLQGSESKIATISAGDQVTPKEYFSMGKDVGRPRDGTARCRNFEASLYLCENYPLSLIEQILPIVDIISSTNPHFAKLKDFLTLQLLAGFPIKIEIPIFHVLNAVVTFDNVHSEKRSVDGITFLAEENNKFCAIDDDLFTLPADYADRNLTSERQGWIENEEMAMMMFALRDSLNNHDVQFQSDISMNQENDAMAIQRAIDESIHSYHSQSTSRINENSSNSNSAVTNSPNDECLDLALQISRQEEEHRISLQEKEAEELLEVLRKSLIER